MIEIQENVDSGAYCVIFIFVEILIIYFAFITGTGQKLVVVISIIDDSIANVKDPKLRRIQN